MSLQYAGERQTFGGPIGRKQGLAFQVSDLQVMLDASRLLTYKAAAMKDAMDAGHSVSMGAFKQAAAVAMASSTPPIRPSPRPATRRRSSAATASWRRPRRFPALPRDAKILEIGEGTSEVQRMIIARGLGLPVE